MGSCSSPSWRPVSCCILLQSILCFIGVVTSHLSLGVYLCYSMSTRMREIIAQSVVPLKSFDPYPIDPNQTILLIPALLLRYCLNTFGFLSAADTAVPLF